MPQASPNNPPSAGGGSGDWLVQAIEGMLVANGWGAATKIAQIKATLPAGEPHRAFLRGLADQRVLTTEQIAQLDVLVHQQRSLPGFQMLKKVGAGGMGTVYLAIHRASGEQIALKVISARLALDSDFLGRFHRETTALQGLRHPHICNVVESGSEGSTHYLAMEYINGPALAGLLKEYRALPESYVLNIVRQVAEGLGYVWSKAGIVHRDIKPENILVQRSGTGGDLFPLDDVAKLIDFGLVKMANEDEHLTQTGMTIGTPLYMSPEQVRGEKLDCRSDIYGLGATTYHLLTGMPPFRASSPGAIMSAHLTEPVPDPGDLVPGLSASVRRLVQTTMAKVADARFIDFTALLRAIDQALEEVRERSGAGKMQLLRKPLVVKKSAAKRNESAESGETLVPTPMREGTSRRVLRKHIELRQSDSGEIRPGMQPRIVAPSIAGDALSRKTGDTPPPSPTRDAGHESSERRPIDLEPGTDALTRTPSSKERALRQVEAKNLPAPPPPDLARSAVFDEDPTRTAGAGIVPWIILAAAAAVAVVCAVWQLIGR
ncbi:MAG: serine/threonine protein kinase [Planctomycetes bacterium]|nr:serine/threonine protein kinase [Planctomycetota bacterium]